MRPEYITSDETAALLALMHQRSEEDYCFVNVKTFRRVAGRKRLEDKFKNRVISAMYRDHGIHMMQIEDGSNKYVLLPISTLHSEPKLLAKRTIAEEMRALRLGDLDFEDVYRELGWEDDWDSDEE